MALKIVSTTAWWPLKMARMRALVALLLGITLLFFPIKSFQFSEWEGILWIRRSAADE